MGVDEAQKFQQDSTLLFCITGPPSARQLHALLTAVSPAQLLLEAFQVDNLKRFL